MLRGSGACPRGVTASSKMIATTAMTMTIIATATVGETSGLLFSSSFGIRASPLLTTR